MNDSVSNRRFCDQCGATLGPSAKFCPQCGTRIESVAAIGCPAIVMPPMQGNLKHIEVALHDLSAEGTEGESQIGIGYRVDFDMPSDAEINGVSFSALVLDAQGQPMDVNFGPVMKREPDAKSSETDSFWGVPGYSIKSAPAGARVVSTVTGYRYDSQTLGSLPVPGKGAQVQRIEAVAGKNLSLLGGSMAWEPNDDEDEPQTLLHLRCAFQNVSAAALAQVTLEARWRNKRGEEFDECLDTFNGVLPGAFVHSLRHFDLDETPSGKISLELRSAVPVAFGSAQALGLELTMAEPEIDESDDDDDEASIGASRSDDIVIRFPLTKGDGNSLPAMDALTDEERMDIRTCLALSIDWNPECMDDDNDAQIVALEIIYDGISPFNEGGDSSGYRFDPAGEEFLSGNPAPIVRFKLDQAVEVEQFINAIRSTSFRVLTAAMDEDPFFADDMNGYTHVLTEEEAGDWIERLKVRDAYSGKTFDFPEGMPTEGFLLEATEFALPFSLDSDSEIEGEEYDEGDDDHGEEESGVSINVAAEAETGRCLWFYAWKSLEGCRIAGWMAATDFKRNLAFRGEFIAKFDGTNAVELFVHGGDKDEESWETHDYVDVISGKTLSYQDEPSDAEWAQDEVSDVLSDWLVGGTWEEGQENYVNRVEDDKRGQMQTVGRGLVFEQGDQECFSTLKRLVQGAMLARISPTATPTLASTTFDHPAPPPPTPVRNDASRVDSFLAAAGGMGWSKEFFFAPAIPEKKLANAIASMAPGIAANAVKLLVDTTVFGGAKEGLLLTPDALHAKDIGSSPKRLSLDAIRSVDLKIGAFDSSLVINGVTFVSLSAMDKNCARQFAEMLNTHLATKG